MDFSLQRESCRISQEHMTQLAIKERDYNHYNFATAITTPSPLIVPDADKEHNVLRGLLITNKNCYFKRPEYNRGEWEGQFHISYPFDKESMFNVQTKRVL